MRQETGSNQSVKSKDIISVRIHQNGDAFVLPEVHIDAQSASSVAKSLAVELLSKRTMLIPGDVAQADESVWRREYAKAGMKIFDNEELLLLGEGDICALVAVSRAMIEELKGRQTGGCGIVYSVPLLQCRKSDKPHAILDTIDGLSTIKVYSATGLQFADVFETPNNAQIAYWLERLSTAISLKLSDLYIVRGGEALVKTVQNSFKNIYICE